MKRPDGPQGLSQLILVVMVLFLPASARSFKLQFSTFFRPSVEKKTNMEDK
jgi:hypothetical protein